MSIIDGIKWYPKIEIVKYDPSSIAAITRDLGHEPTGDELRALEALGRISPDDITKCEGNGLLDVGRNRIINLITGGGGAAFTSTQGFTGVGDSSTAFSSAHTALQAATNKYYQIVDSGTVAATGTPTGQISAACTYGTSNANFAWNEWCWGIATGTLTAGTTPPGTSPVVLNRAVPGSSLGTKASGASWTLNATITIT